MMMMMMMTRNPLEAQDHFKDKNGDVVAGQPHPRPTISQKSNDDNEDQKMTMMLLLQDTRTLDPYSSYDFYQSQTTDFYERSGAGNDCRDQVSPFYFSLSSLKATPSPFKWDAF